MVQSIRSFLPAPGDPRELRAAFDGDPTRWLPLIHRLDADRWVIQVSGLQLVRPVELRVGQPWVEGHSRWRALSWTPTDDAGVAPPARLLPVVDGELGLHEQAGAATLVFEGRYRPPGGALGAAVDSVALRRVAQRTIERFLADVAARLCAEGMLGARLQVPPTPLDPVVA